MNSDEYRDQLVDMLLWESVGQEEPPDVRAKVLEALDHEIPGNKVVPMPVPTPDAARVHPTQPPNVPVRPAATSRQRNPTPVRQVKPSKAHLLVAAAAVALLAGVGAFVFLQQISDARTPLLTNVSGTVAPSTGPIASGERLRTGSESTAVITYPDGTMVELEEETTIVVPERPPWQKSKGIEVVGGGVRAGVSPQPEGNPMVFASVDATAEVVGTKLSLRIVEGLTRLEVDEGEVRFVPQSDDDAVLVKSGNFAEAGTSGFRSGEISVAPVRGITGLSLMNAKTDRPMRDEPLADGESISLASLPTREINLRADFKGEPPTSVQLIVTRHDGDDTGLPPYVAKPQKHPPFFVAGDHWANGRSDDCRAWTPPPGRYHISATAVYAEDGEKNHGKTLELEFRITE